MLERRILGRADGLNDDIDSAAKEFTEVIKWSISGLGQEDLAVWMEVSSALRFCASITEEWADCVNEYKKERRRIINRWNEIAPTHEEDLEKTEVAFRFVNQQTPSQKASQALSELKGQLEEEEVSAFNSLYERSEELRGDLNDGPTPEAVQRLIDNGYMTWSYFNLGGDIESLPIDLDPEEASDELIEYLNDPEGYDGDITALSAILNNIALVAVDKKNDGEKLTGEELNFLRDFYASLEEAVGEGGQPPGVLKITDDIIYNVEIDDSIREQLLSGLGGGLLVLSDENLTGGYDNLPLSIRETVEGPVDNNSPSAEWQANAATLGRLLGSANAHVQGGEEFSINLTQSLGYALDGSPEDHPYMSSWWLESLIDVSTRNEDANHAILTGEGKYEHPVHGLDPEMTLRGLYTFDWEDEGAAASGITDWIWQQSDGEGWEQERAKEAMASFMELFDSPEFVDALSGTGHDVEGKVTNEMGELVDGTWHDASAGLVNPELAWGWSELFVAYIDEFSSGYGLDIGSTGVPDGQRDGSKLEDGRLYLDPHQRESFLQLAMGDGDAASYIYAESINFNMERIDEFIQGENGTSTEGAVESGVLRGLIDRALEQEAAVRETKNNQDNAYEQKVTTNGIDLLGSAISEIPYPGASVLSEGIKVSLKENAEFETVFAGQNLTNATGTWEAKENFQLLTLGSLESGDPRLADMPSGMVAERNGEKFIPVNPSDWEFEPGLESIALDDAWTTISQDKWPHGEMNYSDAMGIFTEAYSDTREKMNEENNED